MAVLLSSCSAADSRGDSGAAAPADASTGPASGSSGAPGSSGPSGSPAGSPPAAGPSDCPTSYAPPDPRRPRIGLTFDVSADLSTVRGTEDVDFVPDLPVREMVFRLTPNGPTSARTGTSLRVTRAEAAGRRADARFERAGADPATQGGLLVIPLGRPVPAGQRVHARIEYTLTLGRAGFERYGHDRRVAWWGTGQPLLAWERGVGWHREPLLSFIGESAQRVRRRGWT